MAILRASNVRVSVVFLYKTGHACCFIIMLMRYAPEDVSRLLHALANFAGIM